MNAPSLSRRQRGVTIIEVLVTVMILAFGLLGLIGLNVKVQAAQAEAYQRAQAILLVQDMANRIAVNRSTDTVNYVTSTDLGTSELDCTGKKGADLDKCEWNNSLYGSSEKLGTDKVGAMVGARGCITRTTVNSTSVYQVSVAWQGVTELATPPLSCGSGKYSSEGLRRAVASNVTLACPTAPDTACAW